MIDKKLQNFIKKESIKNFPYESCGFIVKNEKDFQKLRKKIQFPKKNKVAIACLIKSGTLRTKKKLNLKEKNSVTRANFIVIWAAMFSTAMEAGRV